MKRGFMIEGSDNVAIVLEETAAGESVEIGELHIVAREQIPALHKIAVEDIPSGGVVRKFGELIGQAKVDIRMGDWVHLHNLGC